MILDRNPSSGRNGASHRMYFDTPPLKGNCLGTIGSDWKRTENV
jgi:hypothetical protein